MTYKPKRQPTGLLSTAYDREVAEFTSAYTQAIRIAPEAALPRLEGLMVDFFIEYIELRTGDATLPHWRKAHLARERSREAYRKYLRGQPRPRKLPPDEKLRTEFERLLAIRGEAEARSVIHQKYSGQVTHQAINAALRRAGCGMRPK